MPISLKLIMRLLIFKSFLSHVGLGLHPRCTSTIRLDRSTGGQIRCDNNHVFNLPSPNSPSYYLSFSVIILFVSMASFFIVTPYTTVLHSIAPSPSEWWIIGKCRRMVWTISFTGKYIPVVQRTEWTTREVLCEFSCVISPVGLAGHTLVHRFARVPNRRCF